MKKLLICILMAAMLFSQAIAASAETLTDNENSSAAVTTDADAKLTTSEASSENKKSENTDSDTTDGLYSKARAQAGVLPNESALPDGYEIDPDFSLTITLNEENGWTYNLKDLIDDLDSDDYIYFIAEGDVPDGYSDHYAKNGSSFTKDAPAAKSGDKIIIRNVKEGEPPKYELPKSGGSGTMPYTIAGIVILMTAGVYFVILRYRRKSEK